MALLPADLLVAAMVALRREIAGLRRVFDQRGRDAGHEDIVQLVVAVEDRLDVIRE